MTHTPGPWRYKPSGIAQTEKVSRSYMILANTNAIANTFRDDAEANARLIAAAPEMLKALREAKAFIDAIDGEPDDMYDFVSNNAEDISDRLQNIIDKAEGTP